MENLFTLIGGVWLVVGLFIDGYAHSEILDTETEDFFTPWHAIFYSGFVFTAAVVARIAHRRSSPNPIATWLPPGYGLAAIGIGIFAIGGIGDGIWHTVFGVEVGVDALLSPTHLLLFLGMALILTAPLRAAWLDTSSRQGWSELGGAIASASISTALVAFFFTYVFGIGETGAQGIPFDPVTDQNEIFVEIGLGGAYIATIILLLPVLALLRRWDLPTGAITVVWLVPVLLENLAFDGARIGVLAAIAGGIATELALAVLRSYASRGHAVIAATWFGTTVLWTIWMALIHLTDGVVWIPELWAGQIVICGFIAIALAALAFAPERPAHPIVSHRQS